MALDEVSCRCILVNDGSKTGIRQDHIDALLAAIPGLTYLSYQKNMGKGHALRTGVQASSAAYTVFTDIDFPFTMESNITLIRTLLHGTPDVVVGSRSETYHEKQPFARKWISKLLRGLNKTILGLKVYDTQCGLKGFNAKGKALFLKTELDRYLFDLEFIHLVSQSGLEIRPVEVELRDNVVFSSMPFSILMREGMDFLKILSKR